MKQRVRNPIGYRRYASLATAEDIVYRIKHENLEFAVIDIVNLCGRLHLPHNTNQTTYVAALYFNDVLVESTMSIDTFEDKNTTSRGFYAGMFLRTYLRSWIHRYANQGLSPTEEHGLRHALYTLLKEILPTRYGVDISPTEEMQWGTGLAWMLYAIADDASELRYNRTVRGGTYTIFRGIRFDQQHNVASVMTKLTFLVRGGVGDFNTCEPYAQKSEHTVQFLEPVESVTTDIELDNYATKMLHSLQAPHMDLGVQTYQRRKDRPAQPGIVRQ